MQNSDFLRLGVLAAAVYGGFLMVKQRLNILHSEYLYVIQRIGQVEEGCRCASPDDVETATETAAEEEE